MTPGQAFLERVRETIRRHRMLPDTGAVVLGVSGGPDSLALLHALRELGSWTLHVGHLHHGMRGAAADSDARFVEEQCRALAVPCAVARADVPGLARERGVGEEVAGRDARYAFLKELAEKVGAARIALGHHADDQAETVLMRLMRGAGPRGMGGIPYVRAVGAQPDLLVVRPLLDCGRAAIEAYLGERRLAGRLDSTNLSAKYLRNRVRTRFLPELEERWGKSLREDLRRMGSACQRLSRAADVLSDRLLAESSLVVMDVYAEAPLAALRLLPRVIHPDLLRMLLVRAGLSRRMIGREHYAQLAALCERARGGVALPGGVLAEVSCGALCLRAAEPWPGRDFETVLAVPGETLISPLRAAITAETFSCRPGLIESKRARHDPDEALLDMDRIALPLRLRFRREGDRFRPLGAPGARKLKDLFNDLRIPRPRRDRIPLVVDSLDRVLWLAGHRVADSAAVREGTRAVLRLVRRPCHALSPTP